MPYGQDHAPSSLDVLGELSQRMTALEEKMNTVLSGLSRFAEQGGDFDVAHARHVLNKHFFHDRPDPEIAQSRDAG